MLLALAGASGCSGDKVQVAPPDELYRNATQDYVDGNYGISIQTYKYLLDHYPLDPRAEDVELRIAEAHFANGAFPEAIAAYTDFQRMHPTSARLAEVEFQIGMAYVGQMDTIDRDLNAAANAHARFESVILRYPNSDYAKRAKEELKAVREHLASRELYVAEFYAKKGNHQATRTRAGTLLVTYPETQAAVDALAVVASDARSAGDEDLAQLADTAYSEASANPDNTPSRTQTGSALALRNRIAPNAVASPITPISPATSGKSAPKQQL
ncbi:outer membrane protein assembly factor BamD [Candidatus Binatia bacterium]|nr:outer membrane protein assembly factor BamD [Candidatus Binatia bacterium]